MATLADPVAMIEMGAPHVIHSDEELQNYTRTLMKLTSVEAPTPAQVEAIELLTLLIETYENQHHPIPAATPVDVVRFILDQHNLRQRDLADIFGGEPQVSMFLSGQRNLTVSQIKALSERFHVPSDLLLT